jgi:O-antigen/teichoic acid export membrane protein
MGITHIRPLKSLLLENQSLKQTILKNTFWITFGQLTSRLIRSVLIIYAARLLGASEYGIFSYALTVAGFFSVFADIGLTPLLTREGAKNPELRKAYLGTALFIKLGFVALSSLIILFGAPLVTKPKAVAELFRIVVFLFAFDSLRDFLFGLTRALEKMEIEAGVNIFTNFSILALGGAALMFQPSTKLLLLGYTAGSGLGLLALAWTLKSHTQKIWRYFNRSLVKPILTEAWPFALLGLLNMILLNTDMLMLGVLRTPAEVGYYSAAQKVITILYLLPGFLTVSLFPTFSRLASRDNETFSRLLEKALAGSLLIALPITIGGVITADNIIQFLFGNEYMPAARTFQILMLTLILVALGVPVANAIFAFNKQKRFLIYTSVGALSNIIFNLVLIPPYGIAGAAVATVLAYLLANAFNWHTMRKINYFTILPYLSKILLASLITAVEIVVLKIMSIPFLLILSLSIITYFLVLRMCKEPLLKLVPLSEFLHSKSESV